MILIWLISILFIGGLIAWASESYDKNYPRLIALITVVLDFVLMFMLLQTEPTSAGWISTFEAEWIPRFGISLYFALDGLSLLLLLLTGFLGLVAIGSAWDEIKVQPGFFYFNLLWTLAGVVGVFTALDLFLFFFFWEVMLIPMYFIIAIWGHENKSYAAMKFFMFTHRSGNIHHHNDHSICIFFHFLFEVFHLGVYQFEYLNNLSLQLLLGFLWCS